VFAGISDRQEASSPFDFGSAAIAGKLLLPVGLLKFHLIADRTQMRKIRKVITPAIATSPGQLIYPQLLSKIAIKGYVIDQRDSSIGQTFRSLTTYGYCSSTCCSPGSIQTLAHRQICCQITRVSRI